MTVTLADHPIRASLNFAGAGESVGQWHNTDMKQVDQHLKPVMAEIANARALTPLPSLEREGFTLTHNGFDVYDWFNTEWMDETYIPACVALVQRLTGAAQAHLYFRSVVRMADPEQRAKANAWFPGAFVHIDLTVASAIAAVDAILGPELLKQYPRAAIYNVWQPVSPAPHNTPLALCDQRTLDPKDQRIGFTVNPDVPDGIPYVSTKFSQDQRWYYFPDLAPGETIVFKGVDLDERNPIGCAHSAFEHPNPVPGAQPRVSVETRVVAFFD